MLTDKETIKELGAKAQMKKMKDKNNHNFVKYNRSIKGINNIEKKVNKDAHKLFIELVKWLYDNHKDVLREYEKTHGNLRIEFLGEKK